MHDVECPATPIKTVEVSESFYFSVPREMNAFQSRWFEITGLNHSDFIQKNGALAYLELSHAWLTHCSIKGASQRRDFSVQLISKFEKFLSLGQQERFAVYGLLLDVALGESRTNTFRDFLAVAKTLSDEELLSDHMTKLGFAADRLRKRASRYFYPIYAKIGINLQDVNELNFHTPDILEFVSSDEDYEAYIKYKIMGLYLDVFEIEKSFRMFQDERVQRLGAYFDLSELFTLSKRLFALGWREEATSVTEFATNYAFAEKMDLPSVVGEAEKLRKLIIGGRAPTIKPSHPIQFENIKRLSRR